MPLTRAIEIAAGVSLVALNLFDVFQAVILPRASNYRWRISARFVRLTWPLYSRASEGVVESDRREDVLGAFGPLALVGFLLLWSGGLVLGYGLMVYGLRSEIHPEPSFPDALYFAGVSFLTLGYGDFVPVGGAARIVSLVAAGSGFSVIAILTAFLFAIFGAFVNRETFVVTFGTRAGAPPSGVTLLETYARLGILDDLDDVFEEGIRWSAAILETHLSYPLLAYFRSSHDYESWVGALGALLDAATLKLTVVKDGTSGHAKLCFGMARHAVHDIADYFGLLTEGDAGVERGEFDAARARLEEAGLTLHDSDAAWLQFSRLRAQYAMPLNAMARHFHIPPAQWIGDRSFLRQVHAPRTTGGDTPAWSGAVAGDAHAGSPASPDPTPLPR
jgi:hypothetical protein